MKVIQDKHRCLVLSWIVVVVFGWVDVSAADSTGQLSPGTVQVNAAGSFSWANLTPTSQAAIEGNFGSITFPGGGQSSDEIHMSGFGASIPANHTVTGIEVTFRIATTGLDGVDDEATINVGTPSSPGTAVTADLPNTSDTWVTATFGGENDTWGLALTPAVVNDPSFGILTSATSVNAGTEKIDLSALTIYHTSPAAAPRILLIGDSWAAGMGNLNIFETVLASNGLSEVTVVKEGVGGSKAYQWADNHEGKLDAITAALNSNPTVDIVHINLGGNDLKAPELPEVITIQDLLDRLNEIGTDVLAVVDHIHGINPDIRICWGSYDYLADQTSNAPLIVMVQIALTYTSTRDNFEFMNAMGYLHHVFGYTGEFGPGATALPGGFPEYDPLGGGDPNFPTDPLYHDGGVHLNATGYVPYIERAFNEFYRAWLFEDVGGPTVWVDFAHRGDEMGSSGDPMNDITNAAIMVDTGGTLKIKGDSGDISTPETLTLDKDMRIEAVSGSVTIGATTPPADQNDSRSGFVSRTIR